MVSRALCLVFDGVLSLPSSCVVRICSDALCLRDNVISNRNVAIYDLIYGSSIFRRDRLLIVLVTVAINSRDTSSTRRRRSHFVRQQSDAVRQRFVCHAGQHTTSVTSSRRLAMLYHVVPVAYLGF